MRRSLVTPCAACALAVTLAAFATTGQGARAAAGGSPGATWRAAVETAPGRVVLPIFPQLGEPLLPLTNGNLVIAGLSETGQLVVVELSPNGQLDPAFGSGGVSFPQVPLTPTAVLAQADGKLLVFGAIVTSAEQNAPQARFLDWQILRLLPDGSPDPSFGVAGVLDVTAAQSPGIPYGRGQPALAPDGDIVLPILLGGNLPTNRIPALLRLTPDGAPDPTFGAGGIVQLPGGVGGFPGPFAVERDGSVVVTVTTQNAGYPPGILSGSLLTRLTPSGTLDSSFAGGAPLSVAAVADQLIVERDGSILLLGQQRILDGELLRYLPNGTLDAAWGNGGSSDISSLQLIPPGQLFPLADGKLDVVGGSLPALRVGPNLTRIVRITAAGALDPTLGGPNGLLFSHGFAVEVTQRSDGTLIGVDRADLANRQQTAEASGLAVTALDSSYTPDPTFGGPSSLKVSVRITSLTRLQVTARVRCGSAALGHASAAAGGQALGRTSVVLLPPMTEPHVVGTALDAPKTLTISIAFTPGGVRLLRHHPHRPVTVTVTVADLAGNTTTAQTAARLPH
jgi:uncharacterized delta-60 repeat protein